MRDSTGEDRVASAYYREVGQHPNPTPEEERRLFRDYVAAKQKVRERLLRTTTCQTQEQRNALEKRVCADPAVVPIKKKIACGYLKFVISAAGRKTKNPDLAVELIAEGNIGLMVSIDKFKPELEHRFLTYAAWWIDSLMREHLNRTGGVHVPSHARKKYRKQRQDEDKLIAQGKLADYTVEEPTTSSLDPSVVASDVDVEESVKAAEFSVLRYLNGAGLSRREKVILIYYYALRGGDGLTFRDLSRVLFQFDGVRLTSERIRQVKECGVRSLQRHLIENGISATADVF